jgi:titin
VAASSPAKGKVTVSWDAPSSDGGSTVLGYDVEIDNVTGESTCARDFSSSSTQKVLANTASFTSVPGTKYCLRVRAINSAGTGSWVQAGPFNVTAVTDPSVPRTVSATSPSRGTLTVTWTAPADDGGADVTEYSVEIDDRSGESSCARSFSDAGDLTVTGTSATFTGLDGSAYCVRVKATNSKGDSDWAQAGVFAMSASAPGVPRNLDEDGESKDSIDLDWDSPSNDGGSDITAYVVEYRKKDASTWSVFSSSVTSSKATVTRLSKDTTYEFRVAAVNSAGQGAYSSTLTHSTDS